ncbi:hypothetical protein LSCM1_06115 [Leishmania martiniquensis]|uniref:Uncharacterized protein n=1 Tax=Leishmania martiniquensis TaxID=1580590 RepID=A0A836GP40_9TRYP|nr:hypothetical protein LSCM1_06115 [Leishmania martiniquensis]
MPNPADNKTAKHRQHFRQHYYYTSEQEAGLAHLWHVQRLAAIRLSPSHTIQDAPEVDFQQPGDPTMDHYRQLYADRYAQQVRHDEALIYAQNAKILHHLLLASNDAARKGRNMNLIPTSAQVSLFDNIEDQTSHRARHRRTQQRQIAQENEKLLRHLISVSPTVCTAKELGTWYTAVHKKRVQQLSRFKPAEPFAGARVLQAASFGKRHSHGSDAAEVAAAPYTMTAELAAAPPLLRGHPYPPLSIAEAARTAPASLLPAVRTTSYGGVPLVLGDSVGSLDVADDGSSEATRAVRAGAPKPPPTQPRGGSRPDWQPISATDIPLLHYAADLQLRRDGGGGTSTRARGGARAFSAASQRHEAHHSANNTHRGSSAPGPKYPAAASPTVRRVAPSEEGGATQMWRQALQRRHERATADQDSARPYATQAAQLFTRTRSPQSAAPVDGGRDAHGGFIVQRYPPKEGPAGGPPPPTPQAAAAAQPASRLIPTAPPAPFGSGFRHLPFSSSDSVSPRLVQRTWHASKTMTQATSSSQAHGQAEAQPREAQVPSCDSSSYAYAPL